MIEIDHVISSLPLEFLTILLIENHKAKFNSKLYRLTRIRHYIITLTLHKHQNIFDNNYCTIMSLYYYSKSISSKSGNSVQSVVEIVDDFNRDEFGLTKTFKIAKSIMYYSHSISKEYIVQKISQII